MVNDAAVNFRDPALVRATGMSALQKELGAAGAAYFIRQFNAGHGNYTAERWQLLDDLTFEEIVQNVREPDETY